MLVSRTIRSVAREATLLRGGLAEAGTSLVVAGSAVFDAGDPAAAFAEVAGVAWTR